LVKLGYFDYIKLYLVKVGYIMLNLAKVKVLSWN
jgi:hypothetical protein